MSWLTDLDPSREAGGYNYNTPHIFFDPDSPLIPGKGVHHEWTGMPVVGMESGEGEKPKGKIKLTQREAVKIVAVMHQRGLKQKDLGALIGKRQSSVGKIIRRSGWIDPADIETWKRHLGIGG